MPLLQNIRFAVQKLWSVIALKLRIRLQWLRKVGVTMIKKIAVSSIVFVWVQFVISCGGPVPANKAESEKPVRGGSMTYRLSNPPTTLNYLVAVDEPSYIASFIMLTSRLVDFDHKEQKYVPALAESWQFTDAEQRTVLVKLRSDAKFSDGSPITAEDVDFTLKAMYDDRTKAAAWKDAMLIGDKQMSIKIISPTEFQVALPEKVASVENYFVNVGVLPKSVLSKEMESGKLSEIWKLTADPKSVVSSGAFVVDSVKAGESVTYSRNPHYWKTDGAEKLPYLDKLTLEVVADANNVLTRLEQGTMDVFDRMRPADHATLAGRQSAIKASDAGPGLSTDHIWFNLNPAKANGERLDSGAKYKWFSDKRFRQAVSHAIDRTTIAATTLRGLASPMSGFVSPGNKKWLSESLPPIKTDVARANALLSEAGFVNKGTAEAPELYDATGVKVEFSLLVPAENEPRKLMAAVIQEDLKKIGITMQVVPLEVQGVTERFGKSFEYEAVLFGLSVSDLEPSSYSNFLLSKAATHQWHPSQKVPATDWEREIDRLVGEHSTETDPAVRKQKFNEIQGIMADELPVIPIVARHVVAAANSRVGNFSPSPILPYSLWNIDKVFVKDAVR